MSSMPKREIEAVVAEPYKTVFWTVVAVTDIVKTLKLYETTCIVNSTAATATLYLPNVAEAKGMTYKVILRAGTNAVTIKDGANYAAIAVGTTKITTGRYVELPGVVRADSASSPSLVGGTDVCLQSFSSR